VAGKNRYVARSILRLPGLPEAFTATGELEEVGRMTRLFPAGVDGALWPPADDGPCPVNCCGGNV